MEQAETVIKVENLEKSFKVGTQLIPVIKGMDFEVKKGDFTVIIGPSGSGKSTLLHMLLGLEVPTSGKVYCLNESLYDLPNEDARSSFRKKHVGMVYQQPNWIKSLTVVENVAFPLSLVGVDIGEAVKIAWHSIFKMSMSNWVSYFPTELSGGQQQKIALARAMVTDPEIIIADEPTGNLDYESGQNLMQLLTELNNSGKTVIMVTHDLEYVKYAKRVVKVFDGKIETVLVGEQKAAEEANMQSKRGEHLENMHLASEAELVSPQVGSVVTEGSATSEAPLVSQASTDVAVVPQVAATNTDTTTVPDVGLTDNSVETSNVIATPATPEVATAVAEDVQDNAHSQAVPNQSESKPKKPKAYAKQSRKFFNRKGRSLK